LMAYRAAVHNSTGQSPFKVVLGVDPGQSKGIEYYVDQLKGRLLNIHELVRKNLNVGSDKIKASNDIRVSSGKFQKDDDVWWFKGRKVNHQH